MRLKYLFIALLPFATTLISCGGSAAFIKAAPDEAGEQFIIHHSFEEVSSALPEAVANAGYHVDEKRLKDQSTYCVIANIPGNLATFGQWLKVCAFRCGQDSVRLRINNKRNVEPGVTEELWGMRFKIYQELNLKLAR